MTASTGQEAAYPSMTRFLALILPTAALSACALAPRDVEPGWADAVLEQAPPGEPPASVSEQTLSPQVRDALLSAAVDVQTRGEGVRLTGLRLRAPTRDTAEFVVEARERARPPEPR